MTVYVYRDWPGAPSKRKVAEDAKRDLCAQDHERCLYHWETDGEHRALLVAPDGDWEAFLWCLKLLGEQMAMQSGNGEHLEMFLIDRHYDERGNDDWYYRLEGSQISGRGPQSVKDLVRLTDRRTVTDLALRASKIKNGR